MTKFFLIIFFLLCTNLLPENNKITTNYFKNDIIEVSLLKLKTRAPSGTFSVSVNENKIIDGVSTYSTIAGTSLLHQGKNKIIVAYKPDINKSSNTDKISFDLEALHPTDPEGLDPQKSVLYYFSDNGKKLNKIFYGLKGPLKSLKAHQLEFNLNIKKGPKEMKKVPLLIVTENDKKEIYELYENICDSIKSANIAKIKELSMKKIESAAKLSNMKIDNIKDSMETDFNKNWFTNLKYITCAKKEEINLTNNEKEVMIMTKKKSGVINLNYYDNPRSFDMLGFEKISGKWYWVR